MTLRDFNRLFKKNVARQADILLRKGHDYRGDVDALGNFKAAAFRLGLTPIQIWAVYFGKHVSAVERFCSHGKVESEPIESRIDDCINYLHLLAALIKDLRKKRR